MKRRDAAVNRLPEAIEHHRNGRLTEAEELYRSILSGAADDADATHFLGVLMHQSGRGAEGLEWPLNTLFSATTYLLVYPVTPPSDAEDTRFAYSASTPLVHFGSSRCHPLSLLPERRIQVFPVQKTLQQLAGLLNLT